MCRHCETSDLEWTERDERSKELVSFDRSIDILNKNEKLINDMMRDVQDLETTLKEIK